MLTEKEILEIADPGSKGILTIISNPSDPDLEPELATLRDMLIKYGNTAQNPTRTVLEDFDVATVSPSDPVAPPENKYVGWVFKHKRTKRTHYGQISEKFGYKPQLSLVGELSDISLRKVEEPE